MNMNLVEECHACASIVASSEARMQHPVLSNVYSKISMFCLVYIFFKTIANLRRE